MSDIQDCIDITALESFLAIDSTDLINILMSASGELQTVTRAMLEDLGGKSG